MDVSYTRNLFGSRETCAKKFCEKIILAGDSHVRRVAKSLSTPGGSSRWCSSPYSRYSKICKCMDSDNRPYYGNQGFPGFFFEFVSGLTEMDAALTFADSLRSDTRVLILGNLVNWDVAFSTLETYEKRLHIFLTTLKNRLSHFPVPPMLIVRTGMYYCCNDQDDVFRMFTRKRVLMYNEYTLFVVRKMFPDAIIWNPYALGKQY